MKIIFRGGNCHRKKKLRMQYKRYTISIKISFVHYMKWTRAMLPVVFEEFQMVYIFLLLFSFHYHCQLVKGQLKQKSGWVAAKVTSCNPGILQHSVTSY